MSDEKTPPSDVAPTARVETPPGTLITSDEQKIVTASARTFIKGVVPQLPLMAKVVPAALGFALLMVQHWVGKADVEHKVSVGYETLAPASRAQADEIAELKRAVAQLADSVALQARLALASRPGFDDKGKPEAQTPAPEPSRRRHAAARVVAPPADPAIVRQVQVDAAKNQALKLRLVVEKPAAPSVPATLPVEVPKPAAPVPASQAAPPAQEWPPPIPVQCCTNAGGSKP